jgi:hypothetical protein
MEKKKDGIGHILSSDEDPLFDISESDFFEGVYAFLALLLTVDAEATHQNQKSNKM